MSPEWTLHQILVHQSLVVVRPAAVTSLMGADIVEIQLLPAHVETVSRQRWPRKTSAANKNNGGSHSLILKVTALTLISSSSSSSRSRKCENKK